MTVLAPQPAAPDATAHQDRMRLTALAAGILYLLTFVTSVPALVLYEPVLRNDSFVLGTGSDNGVVGAAFLELVLALACIGTAVVLFPVAKRQSETAALGFVAARVFEASLIVVGAVSVLSVVTLRHDVAGNAAADDAALVTAERTLVAIHDWTFLLGPGLMPAFNALCLGYVMYRSRLVPRVIPTIGLIGAPLLLASATATMFGIYEQVSPLSALAALPIATWELALGVWLIVKGFRPSPILRTATHEVAVATPAASVREPVGYRDTPPGVIAGTTVRR